MSAPHNSMGHNESLAAPAYLGTITASVGAVPEQIGYARRLGLVSSVTMLS